MFDVDKFKRSLCTQWVAQSLLYFEKIESTNVHLKKLPATEISHGLLCLTDHQIKGRGQYERSWYVSPGKNLTFTLAFTPMSMDGSRFHILTLACARAAVDQIEEVTGLEAHIKWPNDVMINGKKVGGILTETVFNGNHLDRLLVGIGLNINENEFPDESLKKKAASLRQLTNSIIDREKFLCDFLMRVEYQYGHWHRQNDLMLRNINQKIIGYGQWVKLSINGDELAQKYKLLGINEKGQLTVIDDEGGIETFAYEQIRLTAD